MKTGDILISTGRSSKLVIVLLDNFNGGQAFNCKCKIIKMGNLDFNWHTVDEWYDDFFELKTIKTNFIPLYPLHAIYYRAEVEEIMPEYINRTNDTK